MDDSPARAEPDSLAASEAASVPEPPPELLIARVRAWLADDPDPADRAELQAMLSTVAADATETIRDGAPAAAAVATVWAQLADRFAGPLRFGTAGLRGPLRAGPNGMNTAVVRRAAAGLAAWLAGTSSAEPDAPTPGAPRTVVIGFDARHRSEAFARDSARVFAGAGLRALLLPGPLPTPVLAFAVRHLDADAGVMVTASHNPATDNGYKVYLGAPTGDPGRGAQLVAPVDARIEAAITAAPAAAAVPLGDTWMSLGDDIVAAYVVAAATTQGPARSGAGGLRIAYTPLHGVGLGVLRRVFAAAGLPEPVVVAEQADPDPGFPTVPFPNPEEPGVMDLVLALGERVGADVCLANDPDADRLAVAVGRRVLTGDELGLLLADAVLRANPGPVAATVVSSTALRALAARRGVPYVETLTGFKWIMRAAPDLVFGYEEAIGYAVRPDLVRDKDGITAAVAVARIAAAEHARGRTLLDRLDVLARELGVVATAQVSIRVADLAASSALMGGLRAHPPARIAGLPVLAVRDLLATGAAGPRVGATSRADATPTAGVTPKAKARAGSGPSLGAGDEVGDPSSSGGALPAADVLIIRLTGGARVVVRPSGTEPKLKVYLEVTEPIAGQHPGLPLADARARAAARLDRLREWAQALRTTLAAL